MPVFEASIDFDCAPSRVFSFLIQPANAIRMAPPELNLRVLSGPETAELGSRFKIETRPWGMRQVLHMEIVGFEPDKLLADQQVEGPFRRYRHDRILKTTSNGVLLVERIDYEPPGGMLGLFVTASKIDDYLAQMHAFRKKAMQSILNQEAQL